MSDIETPPEEVDPDTARIDVGDDGEEEPDEPAELEAAEADEADLAEQRLLVDLDEDEYE